MDKTQRSSLGLMMGLGWQSNDPTRVLADAESAKAAYEAARDMVVSSVTPFDDEVLIAAVKLVTMAQQVAASGVQRFGPALASIRQVCIDWRRPELTLDDALRLVSKDNATSDTTTARERLRVVNDAIERERIMGLVDALIAAELVVDGSPTATAERDRLYRDLRTALGFPGSAGGEGEGG